jgi:hypothetical protein
MNEKEIKSIIRKHENASKSKRRKCFYPNCDSNSIDSHLLQKNGILNQIKHQNHVFEVGIDPFKTQLFYFKKIGVNEAFTFPGFCNKHDNELFKEIETGEIDFKSYKTNLLFSYRILVNELRKKEILIDWFTSIIEDINLKSIFSYEYFENLRNSIDGYKIALNDGEYYLKKYYSDLNHNTQNFTFFTFEIPVVEICAAGVISYETTEEISQLPDWQPLTDIYINLLPMNDKSIVVFGFLSEMKEKCWEYVTSFRSTDEKLIFKKLSDLLILRLENWLCSYSVSQKLKQNEKDIVKLIHESVNSTNENRAVNFNLFDYLNFNINSDVQNGYKKNEISI